MKFRIAFAASVLGALPAAMAATPATVEELAVVRANESAQLDKLGISRLGDGVRFDVTVTARDPAQRAQAETASRVVRYLGRCPDQTLALSSVTTNDRYGKPIKRYLVPPGGEEFSRPQAGSQQAAWIEHACARD